MQWGGNRRAPRPPRRASAASGFLLDRIRRRARPRNRQTRKSRCQPWAREAADPSRDWFWPHRHRGLRCHSRCQLTRNPPHDQAAFTQTVSPLTSTQAQCAAPRPSTHHCDPPPTTAAHHPQRRLIVAWHDPDEEGGTTLKASPVVRRQAAPSASATRQVSRTAVRQSRRPIRRSRRWCDRSQYRALRAHRARRPQHRATEEGRSCLSPNRVAAPSLSFARNRHGSHKLPCRFQAGRNDRPAPVQQGRAARTLDQGDSGTRK